MTSDISALDAVVPLLICPVCGDGLGRAGASVTCGSGHSFDVARQGYVSLAVGAALVGDTVDMVSARDRFLGSGHYDGIAAAVSAAIASDARGLCVDVGGGTGFYLARVLADHAGLDGLVLDSSKPALRRAARAHGRAAAAAVDVWAGLPVADGVAAAVLSVFAPRNPAETLRVLSPEGVLVVVTPTVRHLAELVEAVGLVTVDERKEERLARQLEAFTLVAREEVEYSVFLSRAEATDDVLMGPSGHHASPEAIAAAFDRLPDPIEATVSVTVQVYAPPRVPAAD